MRERCVRLRAIILRALHSCSIVCVTVMATIFEYRDESSGESYNPSDSEPEYSTDSNGEVSESEFNGEAIPYQDEGEGWTMLSNIFQDGRPDQLMPVTLMPVTDEFRIFIISFVIMMDIYKLPNMHMYWSTVPLFVGAIFNKGVISSNRFVVIMKYKKRGIPKKIYGLK